MCMYIYTYIYTHKLPIFNLFMASSLHFVPDFCKGKAPAFKYVQISMYSYIYTYMYLFTYIHIYTCINTYTHMCIYAYIYI
jgi:hypothetical protein